MDIDCNLPEQMTEEWASQLSPNWPSVQAALESQTREQQLQDTRERFEALAKVSGQIVWTARPDGMSHDAPFLRAYTGQSVDDVRGRGWMDAIHPEDREHASADWLRAVATQTTYETEYRLRGADGIYRPFLVRGIPLLDTEGNVREWVGVCTDISERKQLEETLQASEAHFRASFEYAPVGIANATLEGFWFDVNQRLCDMLGYTREELLTRTFQEMTHPDDLEASLEHHQRLLAGSCQSYTLEKRYIRKDGTSIWVNVTVSLVRTPEGKPHHTIGIIEDISERKQLKETLQASEAHFRAVFEHAPVGIGQTTRQGQWVRVNQHLCDMLGYTHEEMLTLRFQDVTHPDDVEVSDYRNDRIWAGLSPPYSIEKRYVRKDGSPIWVNVTISLTRTTDGTPSYTVAIVEDISQRKQLEEERSRLLEREQQARTLAEATSRRLRAMQTLTDTALEHLSLEDLLRELLDRIRDVMAVDATTILLLSEDGQFLTVRATSGLEAAGAVAEQLRIPFGKGLAGKIAASQKPQIVDDLSRVEVIRPILQKNLCSLLGVPLLVKGRVIGVFHVGTTQPHHFTQDDVQLLEMVAYRIALAIDHAHLFRAEQQARAEAAARASQLEATIEAMTEGVGIYTPQGYQQHTNQSGYQILGIDDPDRFRMFTSRPHPERIALLRCRDKNGAPYPPARSPLTRALQGEVVTDAESEDMVITALDGQERYLTLTAAPIRDAQGQLAGAVFVYRDATERHRLERRTHDALSALLEMAEALVEPASAEERLFEEAARTSVSAIAQRLAELTARVMGYERVGIVALDPETTQMVPLAVVTPSTQEKQQWWDRRLYAPRLSEGPAEVTERLRAGEVMVLDTRKPPYSEPHPFNLPTILIAPMRVGKQLVGLLSIGHDNAGQVYTPQEIALAGAIAKLTALVIERDHLLRQREEAHANELAIREANRRMEAFLGIASHELKTPLTTIRLHLQLAERRLQRMTTQQEAPPPGVAYELARLRTQLLEAQEQWARLDRLVNDLLDVSRIQEGRLHLSLSPIDLGTLVQGVVEEQRQLHPGRLIEWFPSCAGLLLVLADAGRISQVVQNILSNALKYAPEDAPIQVGIAREGAQARVWVRDQGPGLTPNQQTLLWQRFYRVPGIEVQTGSGVGMGLGLHICKTIIEQHQGQVGVESVAGQGATFWFTLPVV